MPFRRMRSCGHSQFRRNPRRQPVTHRAQLFVSEYLKDLSGAPAAIRAGYSPAGAGCIAARLWSNVDISTAVRDAHDEILKESWSRSPDLNLVSWCLGG